MIQGFHLLAVDAVEPNSKDAGRHTAMVGQLRNSYITTFLSYTSAYRTLMALSKVEDFQPAKRAADSLSFWNHRRRMIVLEKEEVLMQQNENSIEALCKEFEDILETLRMFQDAPLKMQTPRAGGAFFVSSTGFIGLVPKMPWLAM